MFLFSEMIITRKSIGTYEGSIDFTVNYALSLRTLDPNREMLLRKYMVRLNKCLVGTPPPRYLPRRVMKRMFVDYVNSNQYSLATALLAADWTLSHKNISFKGCTMTIGRFVDHMHAEPLSSPSEKQGWADMCTAVAVWRITSYAKRD